MAEVVRRTRSDLRSAWIVGAFACALVATLIGASSASAAVNGSLKQLPLPSGCIDDAGAGGCANPTAPMRNVGEPAILPNGSVIYVPGRDSDTLTYFSRNASSGALTEKGCLSFAAATGCTTVGASPLEDATASAVSADGKDLYVVGGAAGGAAADGIVHFTLSADGTPTFNACFNSNGTTGCGTMAIFNGANPASVTVAPDGRSVYVGNYNNQSIVVFNRNTSTGALNQVGLTDAQKCIKRVADADLCTVQTRLAQVRDVEVTPDSKQLLTGSPECSTFPACYTLLAFDRNTTTSVLTIHPGAGSCVSWTIYSGGDSCRAKSNFYGTPQIAISPNGQRIFILSRPACCAGYSAALAVGRNPTTGDLTPSTSCIEAPGAFTDCTTAAQGLADAFDIAIGPNGDVYVAGFSGQRIGVFNAAADGTLTPKPGTYGCLAAAPIAGACGPLQQGGNVEYVQPSPDGRHVYGFGANKVFSFAVDHAPVCDTTSVDTPHNTAVTITLPCSDPDGDPLTYEIVSQPGKGGFAAAGIQGNKITYGPLLGTSGPDTFEYRASGGGVTADTATMTVNVGEPPSTGGGGTAPPPSGGGGGGVGGNTNPERILIATPFAFSKSTNKYTIFTVLQVKAIPIGSTLKVTCKAPKGKKCPAKTYTKRNAFGTVNLKKWTKKRLAAGTKLTMTVTKAGNYIGAVKIMTVKKRARPSFVDRCLPPGASRPVGC